MYFSERTITYIVQILTRKPSIETQLYVGSKLQKTHVIGQNLWTNRKTGAHFRSVKRYINGCNLFTLPLSMRYTSSN